MVGSFACPECGAAVRLSERSTARRTRCQRCSTWVEAPFLPRAKRPRPSRRRLRRKQRLRISFALVVFVFVPAILGFWLWSQSRLAQQEALSALIAEADQAEQRGRIDLAHGAIEAALNLAEARRIEPQGGLPALLERRADLSQRDIEIRLETIETLDPDRALGEALTLWERVERDPSLPRLADRVESALILARNRWQSTREKAIRELLEAGQHADALAATERMLQAAEALPTGVEDPARDAVWALALEIVGRAAVEVPSIELEAPLPFAQPNSYDQDLRPLLVETLVRAGYLLRPPASPFQSLWDQAPYRLDVDEIKERWGPNYLQSSHRSTRIELGLALRQKDQTKPIWQDYIAARTRDTPRDPGATQTIRLGLGARRNLTIERLLYDDARDDLREKLTLRLRSLPSCRSPLPL